MSVSSEILKQQMFFRDMDIRLVEVIAEKAVTKAFKSGSYIIREGEPANAFHVITKGKAALEMNTQLRTVVIQTVEIGEALGWSWLVAPYEWTFSARAAEPTEMITIEGSYLRKQCDINPLLGYELLRRIVDVMSSRLQAARVQMLDIYSPPEYHRQNVKRGVR